MAFNRYSDHRILSRPVKIHWAGWETDTYRLQQNGWSLSAEQLIERNTMRLVFRHESLGMIGQTADIDYRYEEAAFGGPGLSDYMPERYAQVRHMGRQIIVHNHGPMEFRPIDAQPQMVSHEVRSLEDLVAFAPAPLLRTNCLVLPEATVDDLLSEIIERQKDAKTSYFRDIVSKEGSIAQPHKFHAQIISLAA